MKDLIQLAAEQNLLDAETVRREIGSDPPTIQKLVEKGFLRAEQADPLLELYHEELSQTMKSSDAAPATCGQCGRRMVREGEEIICTRCGTRVRLLKVEPREAAALPPEVAKAAAEPANRVGRFIKLRELGRGSFGSVHLAWDPQLARRVALKILTAEHPDDLARFRREAQLAAGLSHPNVAAVYEVGEDPAYIAMQYVEGESALKRKGAVPELVGIVKAAAEGVQAAHEQGIIHRDLKPANIMVEGSGRVYVLDFGLAKRTDVESTVSQSGMIAGTPAFMSPEQARGETLDARADVYSLGATLYALVARRPPFVGRTLEVLKNVAEQEPPALKVDRDLRTIVAKAMEKEARRRYRSARELADDLGRYLAGDPIQARPASVGYRFKKRVKKYPLAAGLAGSLLVAAVWVVVVSVQRQADRRAAIRMMKVAGSMAVDGALRFRRKAQLKDMREFLPPLQETYAEAVELAPDLPEPDYWMGRMHRALMDDRKALEYQEQALSKQASFGPALYERAILMAKQYHRRLVFLEEQALAAEGTRLAGMNVLTEGGFGGERIKLPGREELEKIDATLKKRKLTIMADLEALSRTGDVEPSRLKCATGILMMYQKHFEDAKAMLTEAVKLDRTLEEAYEALAQCALELAVGLEGEQAERMFEEAVRHTQEGEQVDQGYLPHAINGARVLSHWGFYKVDRGEDPSRLYGQAIGNYDRALKLNPAHVEALWRRADARLNWGVTKQRRGEDPSRLYGAAIGDIDRALELNPAREEALMVRGLVQGYWGRYKADRGEDPNRLYGAAIADLDRALKLKPAQAKALMMRGEIRGFWGSTTHDRGKDPSEMYAQAIDDLDRALELNPALARALMGRATARHDWGRTKADRGEDPSRLYAQAVGDLDRAFELKPAQAQSLIKRGSVRTNWGIYEEDRGRDPGELYALAIGDLDRALKLNPKQEEALMRRARTRVH